MNNELNDIKKETKKDFKENFIQPMTSRIKKVPSFFVMLLSGLILVTIIMISAVKIIPLYFRSDSFGTEIGESIGEIVGNAVGSFNGITRGIADGKEDGKEDGLSADDTSAQIIESFHRSGKLEVLVAGIELKNIHTIGENDYASLSFIKGNAIFSANLEEASIEFDENQRKVSISIPDISVEIFIDNTATQELAKYQKGHFTGSSKDGFTAYINSANESFDRTEKEIENYDELKSQAMESAKDKITQLVKECNSNIDSVEIIWGKEQ